MLPIFAALVLASSAASAGVPPPFMIQDWKHVPKADDLARNYPANAQRKNLDGVGVITCRAQANGAMTGLSVHILWVSQPAEAGV